jgi:hypothetical protein
MTDPGREELKEQLRSMVAGRGDGIDLDTPFHWVIEGLKQPTKFFEHLPQLLPSDSILYVEGTSIVPEVASFYSSHRARHAVDVVRDTIAPVPDIYHFIFSPDVCVALRQFAETHPVAEMFDHIKALRSNHLRQRSSWRLAKLAASTNAHPRCLLPHLLLFRPLLLSLLVRRASTARQ